MTPLETMTEKDEVLTRLSYDLASLTDTCIAALPPSTQDLIAKTLENGGQIGVLAIMNPWPCYVGTLMLGPDKDPVELFRVSPSSGSLKTKYTTSH